jgi:hypothetical protein
MTQDEFDRRVADLRRRADALPSAGSEDVVDAGPIAGELIRLQHEQIGKLNKELDSFTEMMTAAIKAWPTLTEKSPCLADSQGFLLEFGSEWGVAVGTDTAGLVEFRGPFESRMKAVLWLAKRVHNGEPL